MKLDEAYDLIETCLDYDKGMSEHPERYDMALQIAKEVFQKQIPMKPEMVMVTLFRKEMPTCPTDGCGVGLDPNESIWHKSSYCGNCGQKIDWSEDE